MFIYVVSQQRYVVSRQVTSHWWRYIEDLLSIEREVNRVRSSGKDSSAKIDQHF